MSSARRLRACHQLSGADVACGDTREGLQTLRDINVADNDIRDAGVRCRAWTDLKWLRRYALQRTDLAPAVLRCNADICRS